MSDQDHLAKMKDRYPEVAREVDNMEQLVIWLIAYVEALEAALQKADDQHCGCLGYVGVP